MTRMYQLKKEARQFFEHLSKFKKPIEFWERNNVHENLLQEVETVYITHGSQLSDAGTHLSSWYSNDGDPIGKMYFTVNINGLPFAEFEKINEAEMMDEMQKVLNLYFNKQ